MFEGGGAMRPRERRETGEQDLFRSRLDRIIDLTHALVKLSHTIDWRFLEAQFGSVYSDGPGCPPLPTQLMAGLALLKHMYDLSDEALCDRWIENPYFQFFCGEEFFQHRLPFDRSSLTRWRQRMGEAKLTALIQESLSVATRTEAMKPKDLARVVVDTTVQPKAVMFPTDAKLLNRARERLVRLAAHVGVELRQSYARVGKLALIKHQRYAHAHQFKRANRPAQAQDLSGPRHPRHRATHRRRSRARRNLRPATEPLPARAGARSTSTRTQGLFPARAGSGVHRQGQGASAIRVRDKDQCRHDRSSLERRPVRDSYRRCAGQ